MRKRILAYSIYYFPEVASTAQLYAKLFEALSDEFEITVVCAVPCYTGEVPPEYRECRLYVEDHGGVVMVRVPVSSFDKRDKAQRIRNILEYWQGARRVTRQLARIQDFDLVFTYSQPPILGGMLGVYGSKVTGAPLVYGIQDFNPEQTMAVGYTGNAALHRVMLELDKRSCREAECVVVPGRDMAETLERRFAGEKPPRCEVIRNWADDSIVPLSKGDPGVRAFRERWGLEGKFVVMYSGNLGLYYDLLNLMQVIERFKDRDDVAFAFVGDGAVRGELEAYAGSHGMENAVFIPYQPKDELVYSLNAADVHIVCNARGIKGVSVPSKIYGVMAADVPVLGILEPDSEAWMLIEESGCGVCVEAGDYDGIRTTMRSIIDDREVFVREHSGGRMAIEGLYSKAASIQKYRDCLTGCLPIEN